MVISEQNAQNERPRSVAAKDEDDAAEYAQVAEEQPQQQSQIHRRAEASLATSLSVANRTTSGTGAPSQENSFKISSSPKVDHARHKSMPIKGSKSVVKHQRNALSAIETSSQSKANPAPQPYRHIPQEAARQFARTTTSDNMRGEQTLSHRISKQAIKQNLESAALARVEAEFERSRSIKRAKRQNQRESLLAQQKGLGRSNSTTVRPHSRDGSSSDNVWQQHQQQQRHTFPGAPSSSSKTRQSMMGGILENEEVRPRTAHAGDLRSSSSDEEFTMEPIDPERLQRVDWTQSDEIHKNDDADNSNNKTKPLRHANSIWGFKGKLGGLTRHGHGHGREEKEKPEVETEEKVVTGPVGSKSGRSGLFSRFKR